MSRAYSEDKGYLTLNEEGMRRWERSIARAKAEKERREAGKKHRYRIDLFYSDEDGGYIANVPDLRYCSAFGETYEEALREVLVAMELHLETVKGR